MRGGQAKWRGARGLAGASAVHGLGSVVAIPPGRCEAAPRRSAPTCKRPKLIAPPATCHGMHVNGFMGGSDARVFATGAANTALCA